VHGQLRVVDEILPRFHCSWVVWPSSQSQCPGTGQPSVIRVGRPICKEIRSIVITPCSSRPAHGRLYNTMSLYAIIQTFMASTGSHNICLCVLSNISVPSYTRCPALSVLLLFFTTLAWHSGRTLVFDRRTFPVLRSTCSWRVTTYVGKPSATGHPTKISLSSFRVRLMSSNLQLDVGHHN